MQRRFFPHLFFLLKVLFLSRIPIVYSRNLTIVYLASKLGFQVIWETHDLPFVKNKKIFLKMALKCKIVTNSQALSEKIAIDFGISKNLLLPVHNGVNVEAYDKFRDNEIDSIRKKINIL